MGRWFLEPDREISDGREESMENEDFIGLIGYT